LTDEYYCEKHNFRTNKPKTAVNHIKSDLVDDVAGLSAKLAKVLLGVEG
jgi:hypothetical protein